MTRIKKNEETEIIRRISYTKKELDDLFNEVKGDLSEKSRKEWLVKHRAIKILSLTEFSVIQLPDGTIPYIELSNKWCELVDRESKRAFAKRHNDPPIESLNETYEQEINSLDNSLGNSLEEPTTQNML